jgi:UDP-N-acetylmuramate: L-alanyl-gamma-D-glutamyl-meso-diaminopimelate ligase
VAGVTVLDDFAHHPTAVRETVRAIRRRWPERRLVSVFEPRSNSSRRKVFEQPYVEAFSAADVALFCRPPFRHNDRPEDFMDVDVIVSNLASRSVLASAFSDADATLDNLIEVVETGDVVLIMSNGGFGGIHVRLLKSLAERSGAPSSI